MLREDEVRQAEKPEGQGRGLLTGPDQEMPQGCQEASMRDCGGKALPEAVRTVIAAQGLVKRFGDVTAVAGIDFGVPAGEIFGFLGPNGAGKTTTINMLVGLARPTAGRILVAGIDCTENA